MGVDGYATSEIAGKILITKFPKFLEETKKERRKEEKRKLRRKILGSRIRRAPKHGGGHGRNGTLASPMGVICAFKKSRGVARRKEEKWK